MELFLVRHTSVNVPKGVCYGQTDVPLKETFTQEAETVKNQISTLNFGKVYSSPSSRCLALAQFCNFTPVIDKKLMETNFGDWERQRWNNIRDSRLEQWYADWIKTPATNGESFLDMYNRVALFLSGIHNSERRILVFTHGGVIMCAKIHAGLTTFRDAFKDSPDFGSVTKITI